VKIDVTTVLLPEITSSVRPIYLDDSGELYCVVDLFDYQWAMQWKWKPSRSRGVKTKVYAYRTTRFKGRHVSIWLHKEICLRTHGLPPTPDHTIADHQDGNSLVDCRDNLEWATPSMNRRNMNGIAAQQLRLAVKTGDPSRVIGRALAA
jgi:hypothetical protein